MLKIETQLIEVLRAARCPEDLYPLVQGAIELEHATIPPYLCAYLTLRRGTNQTVGEILRSVVIEEMLHMTIAANLLIAIGGAPEIDKPDFVPRYPAPLPMSIAEGLCVPLEKCSVELVERVFMTIEEPEDPIPIDLLGKASHTIGVFYRTLDEKLSEMGQAAFKGDFSRELVDSTWFPEDQLFRITGPETASAAIQLVVRQGEGTPRSPLAPGCAPAHYYRYKQIVKERRLTPAQSGYSYHGAPVKLDRRGVWNMQPNPDPDALPEGSPARRASIGFASAYTGLLAALHETFNGQPGRIGAAIGLMYQLRLLAHDVLSTPLPGAPDVSTGLSFRYQPTTGGLR